MNRIDGKIALITGGTQGLGAATAHLFARAGAAGIAIVGRDQARGDAVARDITAATGVTVDDIAKRLIDYGFHAPTMSFPVAGTLMVEPTESEDLAELDRFIDAMISIKAEIDRVAAGEWPADDSPLRNAPHTADCLIGAWTHPYPARLAAYPLDSLTRDKYWSPVRRIDGAYGDRNLVCSCPRPEEFVDA